MPEPGPMRYPPIELVQIGRGHFLAYQRVCTDTSWSGRVLRILLECLILNRLTEEEAVVIADAWVEDADAFCVVYRFAGSALLGMRISRTGNYVKENGDDPPELGDWLASFELGEPPGHGAGLRKADLDGVHWWGDDVDKFYDRPSDWLPM